MKDKIGLVFIAIFLAPIFCTISIIQIQESKSAADLSIDLLFYLEDELHCGESCGFTGAQSLDTLSSCKEGNPETTTCYTSGEVPSREAEDDWYCDDDGGWRDTSSGYCDDDDDDYGTEWLWKDDTVVGMTSLSDFEDQCVYITGSNGHCLIPTTDYAFKGECNLTIRNIYDAVTFAQEKTALYNWALWLNILLVMPVAYIRLVGIGLGVQKTAGGVALREEEEKSFRAAFLLTKGLLMVADLAIMILIGELISAHDMDNLGSDMGDVHDSCPVIMKKWHEQVERGRGALVASLVLEVFSFIFELLPIIGEGGSIGADTILVAV
jgi:hypothetical protein